MALDQARRCLERRWLSAQLGAEHFGTHPHPWSFGTALDRQPAISRAFRTARWSSVFSNVRPRIAGPRLSASGLHAHDRIFRSASSWLRTRHMCPVVLHDIVPGSEAVSPSRCAAALLCTRARPRNRGGLRRPGARWKRLPRLAPVKSENREHGMGTVTGSPSPDLIARSATQTEGKLLGWRTRLRRSDVLCRQ